MRISIAMTTYNGEKYLREQLDSYKAQSRQPDELIVCDDCSSDSTVEILENFRQESGFHVRVFRNEMNLGFTKNFEKALSLCTGDLTLLSDQDDVWFRDKIKTVEELFLSSPATMLCVHDAKLVDGNLQWSGATHRAQAIAGYGSDDPIATGALTAIKRDLLTYALPIPSGIVGHDMWLHYLARLLDVRVVLPVQLQFIRRHATNTSNWVVSSTKKINRVSVWINQVRSAVAVDYADRALMNSSARLQVERMIRDQAFPPAAMEAALSKIHMEYAAISTRDRLVAAGWFDRKRIAVQMWARGDYRYFNGLGSFLRDMLR